MVILSTTFFDWVFIFLGIVLVIVIVLMTCCTLKAFLLKNKETRILQLQNTDEQKANDYGNKILELLQIKTTSNESDEAYHHFREKMKLFFPLVHQYMTKDKIGANVIFTFESKNKNAKKILLATHMDTRQGDIHARILEQEVFGQGAFDRKALLFCVFQALEETFAKGMTPDIDVTVVVTSDDESTLDGNEKIVNRFLKQGKFFNLVIEEGIGIIDPTFLGLSSHYALLGIGVTGEVTIRYKTKKSPKAKQRMEEFVAELDGDCLFESKIDRNATEILSTFAKDMPFSNRFLFSNIWLFRPFIKKIVDSDQTELSRLLKTHMIKRNIVETESGFYTDITFQLATHDSVADIVNIMVPHVKKYSLDYEMIFLKEASKVTSINMPEYKRVARIVEQNFPNLYVSPYIITRISEQRFFTKVSDCVVRFSPLYYPYNSISDAKQGCEHVMKKSLLYGVDFYKRIIAAENNHDLS